MTPRIRFLRKNGVNKGCIVRKDCDSEIEADVIQLSGSTTNAEFKGLFEMAENDSDKSNVEPFLKITRSNIFNTLVSVDKKVRKNVFLIN